MKYSELSDLGYDDLDLRPHPIPRLKFFNFVEVTELFRKCLVNDYNVCIHWDGDPDGIVGGKICYKFGLKMFERDRLYNYTNKTKVHGITKDFITYLINKCIDVVIIVDSSSNDVEGLQALLSMDIKVLVIDHHPMTRNLDDSNLLIVNTSTLEEGNNVSGAYATNELMMQVYKEVTGNLVEDYMELAALTLISDICKRDSFNRNVLKNFIYGNFKHSHFLNLFRDKYSSNSISFLVSVTSSLNMIIRLCGARFLMSLILTDNSKLSDIIKNRKKYKQLNSEIIDEIIEGSKIFDIKNLIILVAPDTIPRSEFLGFEIIIRNYLGIVANKMSSSFNKLVFVLGSQAINYEKHAIGESPIYCFSARDPFDRRIIELVKDAGIEAEGHGSAFGGGIGNDSAKRFAVLNTLLEEYIYEPKGGKFIELNDICEFLESGINLSNIGFWNSTRDSEDKIKIKFFLEGVVIPDRNIRKISYKNYEFKSFDVTLTPYQSVYLVLDYNNGPQLFIERC